MLQLDWMTLLAALVVALIVGIVVGRLWARGQGDDTGSLKRQLDDLKRQHQNYQISVTEHFNRTTELIDSLTESYNAIRTHLDQGADELVAPEYRLESARAGSEDLQGLAPDSELTSVSFSGPRDYAPKNGDEEGTLSETYGLRRAQLFPDEDEAEAETTAVEKPKKSR
ncbi:YhcB family protein [Saccharospirillum mangrovi]|uniref:YhcB family protein n=1 Tax=Saccharospirillum mangrovi TaxID=2161747 RepID=UPI0013009C78|nr:DUF1043 family protein [Saccharospirillum mangrovi]